MRTLDLHPHPAAWWRHWRTGHALRLHLPHPRAVVLVSSVVSVAVAALFVLAQLGILSGY